MMKKILSVVLCLIMLVSVLSLSGCTAKETLKFGMGVFSQIEKVTNAQDSADGSAKAAITVAGVLVDKDGKIVKCVIDTAENTGSFTSDGRFVVAEGFKTKYEQGNDYGMKAYANAPKEWFEQVDAFTSLVVGKTIDEVKALVVEGDKGNDEVVKAGCTIIISDFVKAIERAVKVAAESDATKENNLKLGIVSAQTGSKDATAEAEGVNEIDTTVVAVALDNDGKIVAASTDSIQAKIKFDNKGVSTTTAGEITSKKEAGKNYGMSSYGQDLNGDGVVKEWDEQGAEFDKALVGKTASEISALANDKGYGNDDLQKAGCTINVADMVKAAVKAATVNK